MGGKTFKNHKMSACIETVHYHYNNAGLGKHLGCRIGGAQPALTVMDRSFVHVHHFEDRNTVLCPRVCPHECPVYPTKASTQNAGQLGVP